MDTLAQPQNQNNCPTDSRADLGEFSSAEIKQELLARLLAHLGRGGKFQYFFRLPDKTSRWFPVGHPPNLLTRQDVYFGVHPTAVARAANERSTKATICAVNCLFAEFDGKDFGGDLEFARWYVSDGLRVPPSVCIASGGGFHGYWLLSETVIITDANRAAMERLQARWVETVGGDEGAKDTARVLRVPGTWNAKYDPPRPVAFEWYDTDYFPIECLKTHADTFGPPEQVYCPPPAVIIGEAARRRTQDGNRARAYGLAAMQRELDTLARAPNGRRNKQLNVTAFKLGSLVAGGLLDQSEALSGLASTAVSMGTDRSYTPAQIKATIKSGFEDGLKEPRGVPDAA